MVEGVNQQSPMQGSSVTDVSEREREMASFVAKID